MTNQTEKLIINGDTFVPLLSSEQIQSRVKELGSEISKEYVGKVPIFIGVLNGAFIFMSDLIKNVDIECEIDFSNYQVMEIQKYPPEM